MSFESIETDRLVLGRLLEEDAKGMSSYRSLPDVARYQSWSTYSEEDARALILEMNNSDPSVKGKWFQFSIKLKEGEPLIGDIGFLITGEDGKSWIGFTLDSAFWRKGLASEAVSNILPYYSQLGVSEVWASIDPQNNASKNLLIKLGFELIDQKPDDLIFCKQLNE